MIAGPLVVLGIGIVLFINRKKLLFALRRAHGKVDGLPVNINDIPHTDTHVNIAADLNNVTWSNVPSSSTEPAAALGFDDRSAAQQCFNIDDLRPDGAECIDDDPLYSYLKESIISQDADARMKSDPDHVQEDTSFYIPLGDDPLYRSVKQYQPYRTEEGACGFSAEDVNRDNELDSLAKNVDPLYSTVTTKARTRANETSNVAVDFNEEDPLYSVVDKSKSKGGGISDWNRQV
ncbi:uncharacterized protein LOC127857487 [Dreissena polymorpha]|uniref:uncharacterized protein LOC127857487 n=1 Tax=Dreissena polymorpha TaxID=45954 RepID=UPI0022652C8B|nr:uncharacterized protein LOC127857487 [Dreissena polymorpha]